MKCEDCKKNNAQSHLGLGKDTYKLCLNCLVDLVNLKLTKTQFKNLLKKKHSKQEFYLHSDFYDKDGTALQPAKW